MDMPTSEVRQLMVEEFDTSKLLSHAKRQADERKYEDFMIVDCDSHHYETESWPEIIQYIEDPIIRDHAHANRTTGKRGATMLQSSLGYQDMAGRITRYATRYSEKTPEGTHRDISLMTRWMDAMGVDVTCMFPTPMLLLGMHPQPEVEVAIARAYARWVTEHILPYEGRIKTMLFLPFNDPDACYQLVKDFGDKKGVVGFMVTSVRYKPVHDNAYMKTYALMEEMDMPLAFHAGFTWADRNFEQMNRFIGVHALGFTFYSMIHMTNWIANALPERFPNLKPLWIESGLAWIPFMMQRLDHEYMMRTSECPALKGKPSDYMKEMFFASQPMEIPEDLSILETTFKMINAETQLLYASDYPHWDFDLPSTIYDLPFLDEQTKRNILGQNAHKFMRLDKR